MDAKIKVGQSLSRLLNVVDGMVGQGLRVLLLLTTNEQIGRMHAALTRPGRCLANIEFHALEPEEARVWAERNAVGGAVPGRQVLSNLYALKRGQEAAQGAKVGIASHGAASQTRVSRRSEPGRAFSSQAPFMGSRMILRLPFRAGMCYNTCKFRPAHKARVFVLQACTEG